MNTYIILAAGKGANLQPLTLGYPKTSYRLDEETTVLQRMVRGIRRVDRDAEISVVVGYRASAVRNELAGLNVKFVMNPFYEVTNSVASLWFARAYLERENVAIVHGDVVFSDALIEGCLAVPTDYPYVLVDSSRTTGGGYCAVTQDDEVLVMSKRLDRPSSRYCCMTKLDPVSSRLLKQEVDEMVNAGMHGQYFEDALVQMVMFHDFQLFFRDIAGESWAEVDAVDDLLAAQEIHRTSKFHEGFV
ncbi:NTP transferase domain-containing protein [Collinsella tanakaei]|nr:NTP transferase domain-containing protein [Collinsella tanakaei]